MFYCGPDTQLPPGYTRFGTNFECMKKGYGICKYNRKLGSRYHLSQPLDPNRPRFFCGNGDQAPPGYNRLGRREECLRKGYGRCLYSRPPPFMPWYKKWWWWLVILIVLTVLGVSVYLLIVSF